MWKKWGNTGENEEIPVKMRKIGRKKIGKLGEFKFFNLRSGDFFLLLCIFLQLWLHMGRSILSVIIICISIIHGVWSIVSERSFLTKITGIKFEIGLCEGKIGGHESLAFVAVVVHCSLPLCLFLIGFYWWDDSYTLKILASKIICID